MPLEICFKSEFPVGTAMINMQHEHSYKSTQALRKIGLYRGQELLLKAINDLGPCSQNTLREELRLDHSTIAKSVSRLKNSGLVSLTKSEEDKRVTVVSLTLEGERILEQSVAIWEELENQALKGFSPEERAIFLQLAQRINTNLSEKN